MLSLRPEPPDLRLETKPDSFFLLINKPVGLTSQQCLNLLKKKFGYKKIGHHGTLDPFADGLLLVGVGEATKFFPYVDDSCKTYVAELKLGERTDTMDLTGTTVESAAVPLITEADILRVLKNLTGKIQQTPPMFSALKKDGVPLYKLARRGEEIAREPREVRIDELKLLDFLPPVLKFEATVSRGTYIRVLGEQIATALGTVGHLVKLTRTKLVGKNLSAATDPESMEPHPVPIWEILSAIPHFSVTEEQARLFKNGHSLSSLGLSVEKESPKQLLVFCQNKFLGLGLLQTEGQLTPQRLMSNN
jgi:tRNA pseudouridine55 synthase